MVVLNLYGHELGSPPGGEAVPVIQTAALVGYISITHAGQRILWDDWKRDVMVVETPPRGITYARTLILGSRVLFMVYNREDDDTGGSWAHGYGFSRRGCRALAWVGDGENESGVTPNPETMQSSREHGNGGMNL